MASKTVVIGAGVVVVAAVAVAAIVLWPAAGPSPISEPAARGPAAANGAAPAPAVAAPATDAGRAFIQTAEQAYNRGDTAAALAAYDKAQAAYKKAGDVRGEASVAFGVARVNHGNGQSDKARADYTRAAALYQQAGDAAGQARVLVAMGDLEKDTFHGAPAAKYYRQARDAWAQVPEPKSDTNAMLNIDRAPLMPAGEGKARSSLEQADKVFHNIGDTEGLGDVAMLLGDLETNLGNEKPAHAAYSTARNYFGQANVPAKEAEALLRFAKGDVQYGYNVNAKADLADADTLFAGNAVGLARVAAVRGDLERLQGRLDVARSEYDRAATALGAAKHPEEADVRVKLAHVAAATGDTAGAKAALDTAITQYRQANNARGEASATLEQALLAQSAGAADDAAKLFAAAQDKFHAAADARGEARAALGAGDVAVKQGKADAATAAFTTAGEQFKAAKVPFGELLANLGKGDAARAAGNNAAAAIAYRQALAAMESMPEPLANASRVLGDPAVTQLWLLIEAEERVDGAVPDPEVVRLAHAAEAANAAAFPAFSPDGKALLAATQARIKAAGEFVRAN